MTLENWKDLATIIGVGVTAFTFVKVLFEYMDQGAQKRVERFLEMRKGLKENNLFKELCSLIEDDDPKLSTISFKDKRDLLGFFEEVAIMLNSGVIRKEVVHYMFGYYAIRCWESDKFWKDINRDSPYWALFKNFALQMKQIETSEGFKNLGKLEVNDFPHKKYRF